MRMLRIARVALVVTGMAVAVAGCGDGEARMCEESGEAEFCLVENGGTYRTTGQGFFPGSDVVVTLGDDQNPPVQADQEGRFGERGAVVGVVRGVVSQRLTVTGTDSAGEEARFEFTLPGIEAPGPSAT